MANPATPCEVCGKPATHHSTKIINGQLEEHHFCAEHAAGTPDFLAQPHLKISLEDLLNSLLSQAAKVQQQAQNEPVAPEDDVRCGACKLPFSLYRKTMILGCDRCYESFEDKLIADLRKFHGSTRHIGLRPPNFKPSPVRVKAEPMATPASEAAARVAPPPQPKAKPKAAKAAGGSSAKGAQGGETIVLRDKDGAPLPLDDIIASVGGGPAECLQKARAEMRQAAEAEDFERAARLRDLIRALEAKLSAATKPQA